MKPQTTNDTRLWNIIPSMDDVGTTREVGALKFILILLDMDEEGNPILRTPLGFFEHLIPVLMSSPCLRK